MLESAPSVARYFTRKKLYQWAVVFLAIVAVLVVVSMIPTRKVGSPRAHCIMNQRNLQQAVRAVQGMDGIREGDPVPWDKVFGGDALLPSRPVCPEGGTYLYLDTIPKQGTLVAPCSHPEHRPPDTTNW